MMFLLLFTGASFEVEKAQRQVQLPEILVLQHLTRENVLFDAHA